MLHRYDGDVLPYDPSAGWLIFQACDGACAEGLDAGSFVLHWTNGNQAAYGYFFTPAPAPSPPSLWIEWRFRSDHSLTAAPFFGCDAIVILSYRSTHEVVEMYGDSANSIEGGQYITGLALNEFHTYRFESPDGLTFHVAVDGRVFIEPLGPGSPGSDYVEFGGGGGCIQRPAVVTNAWDHFRFGTIGSGEQIIATDPPAGVLDPLVYPNLDRFLVTYDSPNYAYIDDITVEVTGGVAPQVIATRRRDNGNPEDLEVVLDRAMPIGATTRLHLLPHRRRLRRGLRSHLHQRRRHVRSRRRVHGRAALLPAHPAVPDP
ncbi:MAG: hypothetical protein HY763_02715 [Planctomycetes bacterium]|nr:hypothetical protein [Planctomycetota bacterium]